MHDLIFIECLHDPLFNGMYQWGINITLLPLVIKIETNSEETPTLDLNTSQVVWQMRNKGSVHETEIDIKKNVACSLLIDTLAIRSTN